MFPRSWLRLGIFAAIGVACVYDSIGQSQASEPTCSLTYERASATGRAAVVADPTAVFTDYSNDEAVKLLAAINALPPATEYLAEHVLVVETPDDDSVMVALVHDDCVSQTFRTPHEDWEKLRRGAIGDPS